MASLGDGIMALAISSLRIIPLLYVSTLESILSPRSARAIPFSTIAARSAPVAKNPAMNSRYALPVRSL